MLYMYVLYMYKFLGSVPWELHAGCAKNLREQLFITTNKDPKNGSLAWIIFMFIIPLFCVKGLYNMRPELFSEL